jgi:acetoin utilization deacetylase AcuC-like enzyme
VAPRPATDEEIRRVHSADHLALLRELEGRATQLDADTYTSPRSPEVARLAAGSTVDLALRIARGEARSAFALIRPPGHHAERARAMGFCLINNVAVAAQALREEAGVGRVAIIDWDVHHGNGTQHLFETERDVLYLSLHQFPFYPGTGCLCPRAAATPSTVPHSRKSSRRRCSSSDPRSCSSPQASTRTQGIRWRRCR